MTPLIEQHGEQLAELCRRYGVRRLELFGSAARDGFDPEKSDLDFLVLSQRRSSLGPYEQFVGLSAELENLFGRKVDLVVVAAHRNPYFMAEALKNRRLLYAA